MSSSRDPCVNVSDSAGKMDVLFDIANIVASACSAAFALLVTVVRTVPTILYFISGFFQGIIDALTKAYQLAPEASSVSSFFHVITSTVFYVGTTIWVGLTTASSWISSLLASSTTYAVAFWNYAAKAMPNAWAGLVHLLSEAYSLLLSACGTAGGLPMAFWSSVSGPILSLVPIVSRHLESVWTWGLDTCSSLWNNSGTLTGYGQSMYQRFMTVLSAVIGHAAVFLGDAASSVWDVCSFLFSEAILDVLHLVWTTLLHFIAKGAQIISVIVAGLLQLGGYVLLATVGVAIAIIVISVCRCCVPTIKSLLTSVVNIFVVFPVAVIASVVQSLRLPVQRQARRGVQLQAIRRRQRQEVQPQPQNRGAPPPGDRETQTNRPTTPVRGSVGQNPAVSSFQLDHPYSRKAASSTAKSEKGSVAAADVPKRTTSVIETVEDERLCVICYDSVKCYMVRPCNHLCLCEQCSKNASGMRGKCPMCRNDIGTIERVYM